MLLIGSQALIIRGYDTGRKPLDIDVIATFDELQSLSEVLRKQTKVNSIPMSLNKTVLKCQDGRIVEVEIAWDGTAAKRLLTPPLNMSGSETAMGANVWGRGATFADCPVVATLDQLYTLKMSHRYLKNSPHFRKTRDDIMLMRKWGAKVWSADWLKQREMETYTYNHPKLNVMKGDFFKGDGVKYVYDHDDIHQTMAHYCKKFDPWGWEEKDLMKGKHLTPAYTLYMKEGAQVQCDRNKFFDLPEHIRLWGVLEEAQVLALERSQIPFRGQVSPRRSFDMALQKVCTSITSGWFREFAWENFDKVEGMYDDTYVERFWRAVEDGQVRKVTDANSH